jgi:phage shock protein PspC (stress-responsive transcriptional regulator)
MSERPPEAPPGEQAPPRPGSTPTEPLPASPGAAPTAPLPPGATATQALPPPPGPGSGPPPGYTGPGVPPGYAGPPPNPRAGRRLVRRTDQRIIAGVAGGIADYLGLEPWLVRIAFVVLVPFGGFGALAYLIAWLLVPPAGTDQSLASGVLRRPPTGFRGYLGVALILLAVAILASAFSEPQVIWAVALIAFGIFLFRQDDPEPPAGPPPGGGGGTDPAAATATLPVVPPAATATEPLGQPPASTTYTSASGTSAASAAAAEPTTLPPPDLPVWSPPPPPPDPAAAWGAPPPRRPRRRPFLGPLTFAAALIATGVALALDNLNVLDLSVGQLLAVFLTVLGAGLLVGTWWGRAWGLIPVGLLAVPLVALAALAGNVPVEGGVAERLYQPTAPAQVRSGYRLAGGEMILDLSKVKFAAGAPPVQASVAGGRLLVVLPDEVAAEVRGRVGVGSLDLLGHEDAGTQVDSTIVEPAVKPPKEGAAPTVRLDLRSGYGVIEVRRISDPRAFHDVGPFDERLNPPAVPEPTERS